MGTNDGLRAGHFVRQQKMDGFRPARVTLNAFKIEIGIAGKVEARRDQIFSSRPVMLSVTESRRSKSSCSSCSFVVLVVHFEQSPVMFIFSRAFAFTEA
jgi:hypothetical protein